MVKAYQVDYCLTWTVISQKRTDHQTRQFITMPVHFCLESPNRNWFKTMPVHSGLESSNRRCFKTMPGHFGLESPNRRWFKTLPGHSGSESFVAHPSGAAGAGCQAHSDGLQHRPGLEWSGSAGVVTPSPDHRFAGGEQASPQRSSSWATKGLEIPPLLLATGWICISGVAAVWWWEWWWQKVGDVEKI